MAMKFNKEMLLKHRFWIMLGAAVALILVGIVILELSEVEARSGLKKILNDLAKFKAPDGPKSVSANKENAEIARKNETLVWEKAYAPQANLFTWPPPVEQEYDFANGYFANEVKVTKLGEAKGKKPHDAAKSWPADSPFLMHGTFVRQGEDWFEIIDRDGKTKKFFLTKRSEKIVTEDGKPPFADLKKVAPNKLLAVGYQRGKYFGDQLMPLESRLFKSSYLEQVATLLESVDPLRVDPADKQLSGVVQLNGWLYQKGSLPHQAPNPYPFVRYVSVDWPGPGTPIDKEAWIAQEDLWIQTEIYRMIREANDSVSSFTPRFKGKSDERNKVYAFQNSYFDLELMLDKNDTLSFKIKNRLARKQSIDLKFKVLLNNAKGHKEEIIELSGYPLMPAGSKDNGPDSRDYLVKTVAKLKDGRTGVYKVQQVLSWQTAAVKRIDLVSIGSNGQDDVSNSQRTFSVPLRPFDEKDMIAAAPAAAETTKPPPGRGKFGKDRGKAGGPGNKDKDNLKVKAVVGAGNVGLDKFKPPLGLWSHRYVEVTEQARRIPVAVVLIVDQGHVDRVLTSFNNSKLRFLSTQVLLNQYTGSLQPPAIEEKVDAPPEPPRRFGPGFKGDPPAPKAPEQTGGGADLETNMEMVIYGIVTLYQRYPPRPPLPPLDK